MNRPTNLYTSPEEHLNIDRANAVDEFLTSVNQVYSTVLEEGFDRIGMYIDAGEESLTVYLRDEKEIAEYELFTFHANGIFEPHFWVETDDYHKGTFGFENLEDHPDRWFQERFDSPEEVPFVEFQEHQEAFLDELTEWIETFCVDLETIYETDDELEKVNQQLEFDQPEYRSEDQIVEKF